MSLDSLHAIEYQKRQCKGKSGVRSFVITFSYAAPECDNERPDPRSDVTLEVMLEVMPHGLGGDPTSRLARTDGG